MWVQEMSEELEQYQESIIIRTVEPCLDKRERARIIDIMSVPIVETATEFYYLSNDRKKKLELALKGLNR